MENVPVMQTELLSYSSSPIHFSVRESITFSASIVDNWTYHPPTLRTVSICSESHYHISTCLTSTWENDKKNKQNWKPLGQIWPLKQLFVRLLVTVIHYLRCNEKNPQVSMRIIFECYCTALSCASWKSNNSILSFRKHIHSSMISPKILCHLSPSALHLVLLGTTYFVIMFIPPWIRRNSAQLRTEQSQKILKLTIIVVQATPPISLRFFNWYLLLVSLYAFDVYTWT